jgi:hypothetical protein
VNYGINKSFLTTILFIFSSVIGLIGAPGTVIIGSNGQILQLLQRTFTMLLFPKRYNLLSFRKMGLKWSMSDIASGGIGN